MLNYKCSSCGAQLTLGNAGSLVCNYCGGRSFLTDSDFKGYEEFRKRLLGYYQAQNTQKEFDYSADTFWSCKGTDTFTMQDGMPLNIEYMLKYQYADYTMYIAREAVVYLFNNSNSASQFLAGIRRIEYPAADSKLSRCFPELKMQIELQQGKIILAFMRRPNFYPAEVFAPWKSEHLAWVISRMENICCAFKYSEIEHGNITPVSVFINPITHEGALFGDWRGVKKLTSNSDLVAIRKTAILMAENTSQPKELYNFLNSKPMLTAFDDFSIWDEVIEKGFGGHKFVKMQGV